MSKNIKIKDWNDRPITYSGINKIKIPAADGSDDVVFQLPPELQEKTISITENGTTSVVPDSGKDALSKVTIETNISSSNLQETKSVTITENGTTDVVPDTGYDGMKKTSVTVDVPEPELQEGQISISANTTTTLTPDEGKAGFSKVDITVDVPSSAASLQEKTVTIASNGTTEVLADDGYDGMSKVEVTTNVAYTVPNIRSLETASDRAYYFLRQPPFRQSGFPIPMYLTYQGFSLYVIGILKLKNINSMSAFTIDTPILNPGMGPDFYWTIHIEGTYDSSGSSTLGPVNAYNWSSGTPVLIDDLNLTVVRIWSFGGKQVVLPEINATSTDVLSGVQFVDENGDIQTGTIPINSNSSLSDMDSAYMIGPAGYYPEQLQFDYPEGMMMFCDYSGENIPLAAILIATLANGRGKSYFGMSAWPCAVFTTPDTLGGKIGCACTAVVTSYIDNRPDTMIVIGSAALGTQSVEINLTFTGLAALNVSSVGVTISKFTFNSTNYADVTLSSDLHMVFWGGY